MSKKKKSKLSPSLERVILLVLGMLFTVLVLIFSVFAIKYTQEEEFSKATRFLMFSFFFLGCTKCITFFKVKKPINYIRCALLFVIYLTYGFIIMFCEPTVELFSIIAGLFSLTILLNRVLILVTKHSLRDIIYNAIIIILSILLAIGFFVQYFNKERGNVIVMICAMIAISAFAEVVVIALAQMKLQVLFKIIIKTYALEILLGLITLIVAFALVIMNFEPNIPTFEDALWYCFAVVTTIGFGDFVAETLIGRLLSVFLGLYGIIIVAIITSIIVNFYNETSGKQDKKEINQIKKEEEKKDE